MDENTNKGGEGSVRHPENQSAGKRFHYASDNEYTQEETLAYVTPYALNLNSTLIGKALAKPWKRFLAIAIDGLLIGLLSIFPVFVFIPLFAYWKFRRNRRAESQKNQESKRRLLFSVLPRALVGLLFIILFIAFLLWFFINKVNKPHFWDKDIVVQGLEIPRESIKADPWMLQMLLGAIEANLAVENCRNLNCWKVNLQDLPMDLPKFLDDEKGKQVIRAFVENTQLPENEKDQLLNALLSNYGKSEQNAQPAVRSPEQPVDAKRQTVISWVQGLLSDLGLGFGWAAVYFSFFTSAFYGRTPGKYLLGLRVVKIDNSTISLWDAFGRYGGYGAGLATGLLGFIQVYWDPNRQAIQDKIAATMVLDERKADWQRESE